MNDRSGPSAPIGVFDSGIGGLTVMRAIARDLPAEHLMYFGDTARVPYGNKAPETIARYATNIARFLEDKGCKAIVIACNTASAFGLEAVRAAVRVPVIDVIEPVASAVARRTTGDIAVIGTRGTVKSGAYVRNIHATAPGKTVHQQACPLFVPLAEEGWTDGEVPERVALRYLDELVRQPAIESLILGCTHYPLLQPVIEATLRAAGRPDIHIYDSAAFTSLSLAGLLDSLDLRNPSPEPGAATFFVTDNPRSFRDTGSRFLGAPIEWAEHVDVR